MRAYRIRVYGRRRQNVDPRQLAQILILLGRHLYEQQQARKARAADRAATGQQREESPESGPDTGEPPDDE
jgi:hypothetical protein